MSLPITNLFDSFSIDFAGPFSPAQDGSRFMLVSVEHLTGWPLAEATARSTAHVVIDFVSRNIIYPFGPHRRSYSITRPPLRQQQLSGSFQITGLNGWRFWHTPPCRMVRRSAWWARSRGLLRRQSLLSSKIGLRPYERCSTATVGGSWQEGPTLSNCYMTYHQG